MSDEENARQNHTNIIGNIPLLAAIAFIVSVGFAPGSIIAQETSEAIRKLAFLEGIWTGEARHVAGRQTTSFTMNITVTKIAGSLGYYATGAANIPGVGTYSESNLFGYDAGKGLVHLFSVTATGETRDHAGRFDRNGNITFRYEGKMNGKKYGEVIPMTIISTTEFMFESTVTIGGKIVSGFSAKMRKG